MLFILYNLLSNSSITGTYASAATLISFLQCAAFLEVIHGAIGLVPSGVLLPLLQWGGRTHFLLAIVRGIHGATRHQSKVGKLKTLFDKTIQFLHKEIGFDVQQNETTIEVAQQNNPEAVIREFESQPSLHANPSALSAYVKALEKLDRLDQSQFLLNTLQKGLSMNINEVQSTVESNTTFKDVKGAYHQTEELKEIVDYLRDPEYFARLGVKVPKCYLLAGPDGTGKTMLARAVAGEARVPFFSCNGREFETYCCDGARRMSNLFASGKKRSPSIIFIDEIDQIYTKRTYDQLLVELDGLKQNDFIIVIAATDVPESLHTSLVKIGRFDRRVDVFKPNKKEKVQILESVMSKVFKSNNFDLATIASLTHHFSGADLVSMVNNAVLEAARNGTEDVTSYHMKIVMDDIRIAKGYPDDDEDEDEDDDHREEYSCA